MLVTGILRVFQILCALAGLGDARGLHHQVGGMGTLDDKEEKELEKAGYVQKVSRSGTHAGIVAGLL